MKIIWTPEARSSFNANIDYILLEWGEQVALNFVDRVDYVILTITKNPKIYQVVKLEDQLYRCVVVKQVSLYYRLVSLERIDLITFWNNYQNPERLFLSDKNK